MSLVIRAVPRRLSLSGDGCVKTLLILKRTVPRNFTFIFINRNLIIHSHPTSDVYHLSA